MIDTAPWVRHLTPLTSSRVHYAGAVELVVRGLYRSDLMPWQRHVAQLNTEQLADGSWAYQLVLVTVPRQAGKTTLRGPLQLHRCMARPMARCWITAQTRGDARDLVVSEWGQRWRRSPFAPLARLRESQGSEGLYFAASTGSSFRVFAPDEGGLDGKANEAVDVDEAWKFDAVKGAALDNSILPTFLTTGGQLGLVSTAGTARSVWLRQKLKAARAHLAAGLDTGTALIELGLPNAAIAGEVRQLLEDGRTGTGPDFDRAVDLLAAHNPAHGYTLRRDALTAGVRVMLADPLEGVDGVMRAYGNWWTESARTLVPPDVIKAATADDDRLETVPARAALGVGVGLDGVDTAVVACWRDASGRPALRVLEHVAGTLDGVGVLTEQAHARAWAGKACAGTGPVLDVVDAGERASSRAGRPYRIDRLADKDYATACRQVLALLRAKGGPQLLIDGHPAMVAALEGVGTRTLGDGGWAWSRGESEQSIAALEAGTAALWAYDHAPELGMPGTR